MDKIYQLDKAKAAGAYYFSSIGLSISPGDTFPMSQALASDKLMSSLVAKKIVVQVVAPIVAAPVKVVAEFGDAEAIKEPEFKHSKKNQR